MTRIIDIHVPDIGDFHDVPVVELPISAGDVIAAEDTVAVLESDKATLDVPSSHAGRVVEILVESGSRVSKGSAVLRLEVAEDAVAQVLAPAAPVAPPAPDPAPAPSAAPVASAGTSLPPGSRPGSPVHASPAMRRYARSLGVPLADVKGSGPHARVQREDIEAWVRDRLAEPAATTPAQGILGLPGLPAWPKVDFAKFGPVERQDLSRIVRLSGPALARNAIFIPHVTNFDTADITALEDFRKLLNTEPGTEGNKLTLLAFAVKAAVSALKAYPKFNSSLDGDALILKKYWNIGAAVDTPDGLVVPVIKGADQKGLREIAAEMAGLAADARAGRLKATDMQGATFTISSLGGIGGTNFTPIINAPEVAILGMTRATIQPVWDGSAFMPRLVQPMSLSWDHRVVDGVAAARFLGHVAGVLADFRRISI